MEHPDIKERIINININPPMAVIFSLYDALCCSWIVMTGKSTDPLVEAKENLMNIRFISSEKKKFKPFVDVSP